MIEQTQYAFTFVPVRHVESEMSQLSLRLMRSRLTNKQPSAGASGRRVSPAHAAGAEPAAAKVDASRKCTRPYDVAWFSQSRTGHA